MVAGVVGAAGGLLDDEPLGAAVLAGGPAGARRTPGTDPRAAAARGCGRRAPRRSRPGARRPRASIAASTSRARSRAAGALRAGSPRRLGGASRRRRRGRGRRAPRRRRARARAAARPGPRRDPGGTPPRSRPGRGRRRGGRGRRGASRAHDGTRRVRALSALPRFGYSERGFYPPSGGGTTMAGWPRLGWLLGTAAVLAVGSGLGMPGLARAARRQGAGRRPRGADHGRAARARPHRDARVGDGDRGLLQHPGGPGEGRRPGPARALARRALAHDRQPELHLLPQEGGALPRRSRAHRRGREVRPRPRAEPRDQAPPRQAVRGHRDDPRAGSATP